jgi:hypothetical protein
MGFTLNRALPGSICDCGHEASYHVSEKEISVHRPQKRTYATYVDEAGAQPGNNVYLKYTSKINISYTISEDLSGNRGSQILSRICQKKARL